jgi:phosphoenolpyruvate carboxykinase (GTP)
MSGGRCVSHRLAPSGIRMSNSSLRAWVHEVAALTRPQHVHWCDGSQAEIDRLCATMVADGSLIPLDPVKHPGSFYARSHVNDVARVEDRTFICCPDKNDAGPTNNWYAPSEMHAVLERILAGCMRGRTMYVLPYLMGPPKSPMARVGIEITDSPYVVANMRIMTRMGQTALEELGDRDNFVKGIHSVVTLNPAERYISHFPAENLVISVNSNYGGNALLGKKCFALRLASVLARDEGWMAEHMLLIGITDPNGRKTYIAAAFPSACGKTNLAMLVPPPEDLEAGWKVETIGDDIAWLKFGPDGRLHGVNPEAGFFGVAPGTSLATNPNAMLSCRANTIFTNVALLSDHTVWWEGMDGPPPTQAFDWRGNLWTPQSTTPAAHPNSRFTAPASQCPSISPDWERPEGVPIHAILFGGRRTTTIPLVYQAFHWRHGTFVGASITSEKTAAAEGKVGELRHDPMAMLPFCGYHMGDYWRHWIAMGERGGERMPSVFHVNWFRKDANGRWLWPGFRQNMRVLKWMVRRVHGEVDAEKTAIGLVPRADDLGLKELGITGNAAEQLLGVDRAAWMAESEERDRFFQRFGDRLPPEIFFENAALRFRLVMRRSA